MVQFKMDLKIQMYVAILIDLQPQKKQETKEEHFAFTDSWCTGNFMAVSSYLNSVRPTTNIINEIPPNRQVIRSTMEDELYLPMLLNI